jgi:hypothetical protein
MHTYEPFSEQEQLAEPDIEEFRFLSPLDVAEWARYNEYIGHRTYPEIWHLDLQGQFQCYTPGYSTNSLQRWAADPQSLFISREHGLAAGDCPNRWLIIETLVPWRDHIAPNEADAYAFGFLRSSLATVGVELVDAVMFDNTHHWWSMNEMVTGSLDWSQNRVAN